MYGAFDVVLYFVIIQLFWLLINLLLILSYLMTARASSRPDSNEINQAGSLYGSPFIYALPALPRLKPVHTEAVTKTSPENGQPKQFDY